MKTASYESRSLIPYNFDINAVYPREDRHHADNHELRAIWWRLRRRGHRLPAERGVILIRGAGL